MSGSGQFLPRHLTERAAALPHKAATLTVRYRGSYRRQVGGQKNVQRFCRRATAMLLSRLCGDGAAENYAEQNGGENGEW